MTNLKGAITEGAGYSSDTQQIAPEICYNTTSTIGQGSTSVIKITEAMYFSDLQEQLGIDVTTAGKFGMFSAGIDIDYMKSVEDKDYSLSLNYYYYMYNTVYVELAGFGQQALNGVGQSYYQNGKNPYYGIDCGDYWIDGYDQGAMLIMSININFNSNYDKEQFTAKASASFGNIFSAAGSVSSLASSLGIQGSVGIQATQTGGDPSQLAKILSKNSNGEYYALTCSLNNMNDCENAANGLLNYATTDFTTQVSFADNIGLTPLGLSFTTQKPIKYSGLTPPPSLVNQTVIEDRLKLAENLLENQYYEQKFYELLNGYPVQWDTTSSIYQTSQTLYQQAQNNINILMSPGNSDNGALGCYDYPDQCDSLTQSIMASLQPITQSDLGYLSEVQYILPADFGTYYFTGSDYSILPGPTQSNGDHFNNLVSIVLTDSIFQEVVHYIGSNIINTECVTSSSTNGIVYNGYRTGTPGSNCGNGNHAQITSTKITSPFYFTAYNGTDPTISMAGEGAGGLHDLHV